VETCSCIFVARLSVFCVSTAERKSSLQMRSMATRSGRLHKQSSVVFRVEKNRLLQKTSQTPLQDRAMKEIYG